MSTNVDASRSWRGRYVALAVLLGVAALGIIVINRTDVFGSDEPADTTGGTFQAQLSAKVVNVLEQMPATDHGHAGHSGSATPSTLVCGVRIFGTSPADAGTLDEVAQVYAYHMCAVAEPGRAWAFAVKLTGPTVISLAATPPTITVAEGGPTFRSQVQRMFPKQYQAEAFNENLTEDGMQELIGRYKKAAAV